MADVLPDAISAQGLTGCIDGVCGLPIIGRGRCRKHYMRWWRRTSKGQRQPALNFKTKTPAQRFWAKVDQRNKNECWPWRGSTTTFGHGEFYVSPERRQVPAHVYALELATGESCPTGMEGCHHCDNPACCNPDHIYYGTRQQNVDDMWRRNRGRRGSRHASARVTEEIALRIRERFASGDTQPDLAGEFGLTDSGISSIVNGKTWAHVGGPIKTHARPGRRPNRKAA
ncbi:HNH endonuclease [Verrucosispora sp. NA02020]|uniref:HNH endonuclease n=1 Tax=Verrucosispora sp. NA02020 TaxID=2742132 RepID=UPI00158FE988|nr:HNH endonuclease [Verrucosispora sp. NA02020]QKW15343.1 HNH endonuclease [Verrucosispora sp. NA02020]